MPVWVRSLAVLALLIAGPALAQTPAPPPASPPEAAAPASSGPPSLSRSDLELVVTLLRNTLSALHQANITGNYTVLRDLGAPGFRDTNTAARLAEIFALIREREVDLSRVVLLDPQLTDARINPNGMLYLAGGLATEPVAVKFELLYEAIEGTWRLFGISIAPETGLQPGAPPVDPAEAAPPAPAATPTGAAAPPAAPAPPTPAALPAAGPASPGVPPIPLPRP
jgi:hypothetical protein